MQQNTNGAAGGLISANGRSSAGVWRSIRAMCAAADRTLALWSFRARTRRDLMKLDDRLLRDAGLDPIDARKEANKPFWRP